MCQSEDKLNTKESELTTWDEGQFASSSEVFVMITAVSVPHAVCEGTVSHHLLKQSLLLHKQAFISTLHAIWGYYR